jgi:hypothetical protein
LSTYDSGGVGSDSVVEHNPEEKLAKYEDVPYDVIVGGGNR